MAESLVIVGSGPAAWTAALYAARANLRPLVFEGAVTEANRLKGTLPLGQLAQTTEVENYPGFPYVDALVFSEFSRSALPEERYASLRGLYEGRHAHRGKRAIFGPEIMEYMRQQALNVGARVVTDDVAEAGLRQHPFVLTASEGSRTEALALVIATGAHAQYLGVPSEERFRNNGVSACAVCDGALSRFREKQLVVVGGGDSAVEEAIYLSRFAAMVRVVHRRDQLRASKIMQQRLASNPKIEMKWNRVVTGVLGNDEEGVTAVRVRSSVDNVVEEITASGMFVAIGHTPNTDFLEGQLELDEKGYIKWQQINRTHTSIEGVFAAGDVADNHYRQAVSAAGTGCMAALDAERWLATKGFAEYQAPPHIASSASFWSDPKRSPSEWPLLTTPGACCRNPHIPSHLSEGCEANTPRMAGVALQFNRIFGRFGAGLKV